MILRGVGCQQVATSIAFHSPLVDGAVEPFERAVARVALRAPRIPFVSCATGQWITEAEATSPQYWAQHLRRSVRFDAALERLWEEPSRLLLEVGPGRTLSNAIRRDPRWDGQHDALAVARHPSATVSDDVALQEAVARLWMAGADIDWAGFTAHETRHRVPLPTYPFERKKYWIAPAARSPDEQKLGTVAAPATSAQEPILCDVTGIEPADFEATDANREIERQVAQVWQEVMGTEHIDRHESMFNVGADSLTVAQLASRLNAVFDVELPLRVVFESMTIARMADAVTESLLEKLSELSDEEARQMLAEP
jgi:acyl transferase domain-containing protein